MEGEHRLNLHGTLKLNYDIYWKIDRVESGWNWYRYVSNGRF